MSVPPRRKLIHAHVARPQLGFMGYLQRLQYAQAGLHSAVAALRLASGQPAMRDRWLARAESSLLFAQAELAFLEAHPTAVYAP